MNYSDALIDFLVKYAHIVHRKERNRKLCFGFESRYTKNGSICEGIRTGLFVLDSNLYDNDKQYMIHITEECYEIMNSINTIKEL